MKRKKTKYYFIKRFHITVKVKPLYAWEGEFINQECYAYLYYYYKRKYWLFGKKIKKLYIDFDIPYKEEPFNIIMQDEYVESCWVRNTNRVLRNEGKYILYDMVMEYCRKNNLIESVV